MLSMGRDTVNQFQMHRRAELREGLKGYICLFLLNLTLVKAINQATIFSFIAYALKLYNFFGPNFILVSVISLSTYIETDSASTTCVFVSYYQHEQAQALSNIYW